MSFVKRWTTAAVFALMLVVACDDSTGADRTYQIEIFGTARDPAGAPVAGTNVTLRIINLDGSNTASLGRCAGSPAGPFQTTTGSSGRYSVMIDGRVLPAFMCLFVNATSSAGGRQMTAAVEVDSVHLGPAYEFSLDIPVTLRP
jgi:hypothetical protein